MYQRCFKRILDFVLSLAAAVVLAIPMAAVAVWVKCVSPGSVFSSTSAKRAAAFCSSPRRLAVIQYQSATATSASEVLVMSRQPW